MADQLFENQALKEMAKGRMKVKSPYAPCLLVGGASRQRCVIPIERPCTMTPFHSTADDASERRAHDTDGSVLEAHPGWS